ncbi:MAG TPA: hypothetical protein VFV08_14190, partial [Puia sp.]|nr:hypothetical protein [Puia sp.]
WQGKLIEQWPDRHEMLDTYASLLYKLGRTEEAIQWEEKALSTIYSSEYYEKNGLKKTYQKVIEQMKNSEPTYLEEGAIWLTKK